MREHFKNLSTWLGRNIWLVAACCAFAETLWLSATSQLGGAAITAALAVAGVLFHHLPIVESFKILSVEARLRRRIDEAEQLLTAIRELALVSSRQMYLQLGWMNRIGTASLSIKRQLVGELNELLEGLTIPNADVRNAREPYLRSVGVDLYGVYAVALSNRIQKQEALHRKQMKEIFPGVIDARETEKYGTWQRLTNELGEMSKYRKRPAVFEDQSKPLDMRGDHIAAASMSLLPPDDRTKLEGLWSEICALYDACREQGNLTPEAEKFLEAFDDHDGEEIVRKVFRD